MRRQNLNRYPVMDTLKVRVDRTETLKAAVLFSNVYLTVRGLRAPKIAQAMPK
jgi:hypothetical protein